MSLLRLLMISFGVIGLLALAGCRTAPTRLQNPPPPTSSSSGLYKPLDSPIEVAKKYLGALQEADYATAYELLSKASQLKHSRESFEETGKRKGMPSYDLSTAKLDPSSNSEMALIDVGQLEDRASIGIPLILEEGQWKIDYQGGRPGAPERD